jgi:hypothetical protein
MLLGFGFLMILGGSGWFRTAKTAPAFYVVLILHKAHGPKLAPR